MPRQEFLLDFPNSDVIIFYPTLGWPIPPVCRCALFLLTIISHCLGSWPQIFLILVEGRYPWDALPVLGLKQANNSRVLYRIFQYWNSTIPVWEKHMLSYFWLHWRRWPFLHSNKRNLGKSLNSKKLIALIPLFKVQYFTFKNLLATWLQSFCPSWNPLKWYAITK